mmetsp:Transcript_83050/g.220342  ORF Transcript_83050/g.220342 Transcript_83050/m.220342 type:complete len:318 (+) Transcript_83050:626-1579(+)
MVIQPAHRQFSTSTRGRCTPSPAWMCTAKRRRGFRRLLCSTTRKVRNMGMTSSMFMMSTNSSNWQSSRAMSINWNTRMETVPKRRRWGILLTMSASCSIAKPAWSWLSSVIWSRVTFWKSAPLQLNGSVMRWEATKRLAFLSSALKPGRPPSSRSEILKSGGARKPGPHRGSSPVGVTARCSRTSPGKSRWTKARVCVEKTLSRQTSFRRRTFGRQRSGDKVPTVLMLKVSLSTLLNMLGSSRNSSSSASESEPILPRRILSTKRRFPQHFTRISPQSVHLTIGMLRLSVLLMIAPRRGTSGSENFRYMRSGPSAAV